MICSLMGRWFHHSVATSISPMQPLIVRTQTYRETTEKIKGIVLSGWFKDIFKFSVCLNSFLDLAKLREWAPGLPFYASYCSQWDYVDVVLRKIPKMVRDFENINTHSFSSLVSLSASWIDAVGGAIKLAGRFTPSGSYMRALGLPVTALTAAAYGFKNSLDAHEISQELEGFTLYAAQDMRNGAQFEQMKGVYSPSIIAYLKSDEKIEGRFVAYVKDYLNNKKWKTISEAVNSSAATIFLIHASLAGLCAVSAGALLALMVLGYISSWSINRYIPVAPEFQAIKMT